MAASIIADLSWYVAGVRIGRPVLRTLFRIVLSTDSCVRSLAGGIDARIAAAYAVER